MSAEGPPDCGSPKPNHQETTDLLRSIFINGDMVSQFKRGDSMYTMNPQITPEKRTILLDWLQEVSKAFNLQRATYYMAQDYVDRFLFTTTNFPQRLFQLLGITSLYVAAKRKERKLLSIDNFSDVTAEACTSEQILQHEKCMLMALQSTLNPPTPNEWLKLYLHIAALQTSENKCQGGFGYPPAAFTYICRLLDVVSLDGKMINFPYPVIAASAIALTYEKVLAVNVSGIKWEDLKTCVFWMLPFYVAIEKLTGEYRITKPELNGADYDNHDTQHLLQSYDQLTKICLGVGQQFDLRGTEIERIALAYPAMTNPNPEIRRDNGQVAASNSQPTN